MVSQSANETYELLRSECEFGVETKLARQTHTLCFFINNRDTSRVKP